MREPTSPPGRGFRPFRKGDRHTGATFTRPRSPDSARPGVAADVPRPGNGGEVARATRLVRGRRQPGDLREGPSAPSGQVIRVAALRHARHLWMTNPTPLIRDRPYPAKRRRPGSDAVFVAVGERRVPWADAVDACPGPPPVHR
jgi:hypothetical protein